MIISKEGGVWLIDGTPSKRVVEKCEALGLIKFPSSAWRNHVLAQGPRPQGPADLLPDEPGGAAMKPVRAKPVAGTTGYAKTTKTYYNRDYSTRVNGVEHVSSILARVFAELERQHGR